MIVGGNDCPVVVISIREDAPFGFRLTEVKGKKNECINDELELKIVKQYAQGSGGKSKPGARIVLIDLAWALINSAEFLYRH